MENLSTKVGLKEEFEQNGYIILRGLFQDDELEKYRILTENIINHANKHLEDPFTKYYLPHRPDQGVLYDLYQRHPEFRALASNTEILDALSEIIGEDIILYENCLVYKPKKSVNEVPYHQDFMSRPNEPLKVISWVALDDVDVKNGALKVIPGSHKHGFLPWFKVKGETHHTRLKLDTLDTSKHIHLEMGKGDVLLFNQKLVHGSDRTDSDRPRRAYRVSYQGFEQIISPRATPIVLRGGNPKHLPNHFPRLASEVPKPPLWRRGIHALANRLLRV